MLRKLSRDYSNYKSDDSSVLSEAETDITDLSSRPSGTGADYVAFDITGGSQKESVDFTWLLKSSIEEALSFFLEWAPMTIILYFISNYSKDEVVNGYGIGIILLNCFGNGLYYGLGSGLETMASHANGAGNYRRVGVLFQKTLYVSAVLYIPICVLMYFSENLISLWMEDEATCKQAGQICFYCLPGVFFGAIYYSFKAILNAQNEYRVQVYSSSLSAFLTVFYSYIFIYYLELEIVGAAITFCFTQASNLCLSFFFASRKEHLSKCFIPYTRECFDDIWPFLSQAIPIGSLVSLEWILQEVNSIIASRLTVSEVGASIILSNLTSTCVQFPLGYATAACTFIGNEMGRRNVQNAKKYACFSAYILAVHLLVTTVPVYLLRDSISEAFAVNEEVKEQMSALIEYCLLVYCLDSIQSLVTAFMRSIAKEKFSSFSFLLCYALIGLSSSYSLAYQTSLGIKGIWIGIAISMTLYLIMQAIMIKLTDLKEMALIISERLKNKDENLSTSDTISIISNQMF